MSRSKLRNKWMQKVYADFGRSFANSKMPNIHRNPHRYITTHCGAYVYWLQESSSYGGHSIPKGGHRRVSGLVRAKVRKEIRNQISEELNQL